jgi:CHAT domain-containing protein
VALGDVAASDGRLLMEKYDLRIVSSTKDILRDPRKTTSSDIAVLVGNPAFDFDDAQERAAIESLHAADAAAHVAPELRAEVSSLRSCDLEGAALKPLPGTQVEVEEISSLLEKQRWRVQVYTQQKALKETVMEVKGPRVLHLATHGFFEPDQQKAEQRETDQHSTNEQPASVEDPMLRSGLFFAGANRGLSGHATAADLDDGVLTAYEASQIDLQGTELVVLSACETGLGEVAAGEGVFGLRRALQVAGADSVLMSMWAVPDKETQELMALFYEKWLAGKDKHVALREAQLEMRARVKARYGEDRPQYWGAFVIVGR